MRITFVLASYSLSGGSRVIATFAKQLHERGHTVNLIARPLRPAAWRTRLKTFYKSAPANESHFDTLPMPRRILESYRPVMNDDVPDADVVVATWWETAEWVAALAPRKGAKAYLVQHHETFDYLPRERAAATYHLPLHKMIISQWLRELMQSEYGDRCMSRIRQGVDAGQFHAPPRDKQAVPTIGFMYSVVPWKGATVIRQAVEQVRAAVPNLRVRAFGLEAPSRELPLPPNTDFLCRPPQDELSKFFAGCDVWVCGSWMEGFTLPPMEAMACRCPVVSTRVGGPDEMIRDAVNGYLVEPGDAVGLAERIVRVLQLDNAGWRAMSDAAHATIADYTWGKATDSFEAALCLAIERTQRGEL
jgi:glycosyltransferase involved in cell wall biosynthesis